MTSTREIMTMAETVLPQLVERLPAEEVHATVLPRITELSVLNPNPATDARREIYEKVGVLRTPTQIVSRGLTDSYAPGTVLLIKPEHLQNVGSYKIRGASAFIGSRVRQNAALGLPPLEFAAANSAGNHIQGVIWAADAYGIRTVAHLPNDISPVKAKAVQASGTEVYFYPNLEWAGESAKLAGDTEGGMYIPPYDDPDIMAGASTIGSEAFADMLEMAARGEIDLMRDEIHFMLPVGGGGCAAGNAILLKSLKEAGLVGDNVQAWAVQAPGSNAIEQDKYDTTIEAANPHYGGVKVTKPGKLTKAILQDESYARFLTVSDGYTGEAMQLLKKHHGVDVESAGALSMAGALKLAETLPAVEQGRRRVFLTITSGANVDADTVDYFANAAREKQSADAELKRLAFAALSARCIDESSENIREPAAASVAHHEDVARDTQVNHAASYAAFLRLSNYWLKHPTPLPDSVHRVKSSEHNRDTQRPIRNKSYVSGGYHEFKSV